jgi:hypothetical protein
LVAKSYEPARHRPCYEVHPTLGKPAEAHSAVPCWEKGQRSLFGLLVSKRGRLPFSLEQLILHRELTDAAQGLIEFELERLGMIALAKRSIETREGAVAPVLKLSNVESELAGKRIERFAAKEAQNDLFLASGTPALSLDKSKHRRFRRL